MQQLELPPLIVDRVCLRGAAVAELGCGSGTVALHVAPLTKRFVGVDRSPVALRQFQNSLARRDDLADIVELVESRAELLPSAYDDTFDVVLSVFGAIGFGDPDVVIDRASRLLRPGGVLAFSFASRAYLGERYTEDVEGRGRLSIRAADRSGATVRYWSLTPSRARETCENAGLAGVCVERLCSPESSQWVATLCMAERRQVPY